MSRDCLSLPQARRLALGAQGLDRPRPEGRVDVRHVRRVARQLGLLQLDYVNVLVPAHYMVLFSRLGPFDRSRLDDLAYRRRELTEAWAHERSLVPVDAWPLLRHRRETHRPRPWGFEDFLEENPDYVEGVLEQVRCDGPLSAEELPEPEGVASRLEHAWFGTVPKATLEAHFGRGRLAIARRRSDFSRVYDLAERVVPPRHYRRRLEPEEARRELVRRAARAHGVATAKDLADYYRMGVRRARRAIAALAEAGELREVSVEGWKGPAYLDRGARLPRRVEARTLLSPFDPAVWTRERMERLFGFEYRLEIFVPEAKRRWGYYVLPFLLGDRLVARVDLKADRESATLRVPASYLEQGHEAAEVAPALAEELRTLAGWLGLGAIAVGRKGDLARALAAAVDG